MKRRQVASWHTLTCLISAMDSSTSQRPSPSASTFVRSISLSSSVKRLKRKPELCSFSASCRRHFWTVSSLASAQTTRRRLLLEFLRASPKLFKFWAPTRTCAETDFLLSTSSFSSGPPMLSESAVAASWTPTLLWGRIRAWWRSCQESRNSSLPTTNTRKCMSLHLPSANSEESSRRTCCPV